MSEVSRALFEPIKLRGLEVRNRIWVPPMCQYVVDKQDGVPVAWHLMHYGSLARGGAGGVVVEATGVVPEGRISRQDLGLWNDRAGRSDGRPSTGCHDRARWRTSGIPACGPDR